MNLEAFVRWSGAAPGVVITAQLSPACCMALQALAVAAYLAPAGITVREAIELYERGELEEMGAASLSDARLPQWSQTFAPVARVPARQASARVEDHRNEDEKDRHHHLQPLREPAPGASAFERSASGKERSASTGTARSS